jgi:dolichol-phosphate mannosyltransferase
MTRIVKGFLDLLTVYFLTGFEQRPQHLLGTCGIAAFGIGLVGITYLSLTWILANATGWNHWFPNWRFLPLHERPALLYSVAMLLLGAQFISMGFLAELFTAYFGRTVVTYSIKDRAGRWPEGKAG